MKFSVCIGTVRPKTLGAAVESICRQSWPDWELIIIGQGNDPTLRAVGEQFAASDPHIRYQHINRFGISAARNTGFQLASGDIIAYTDDDCEAHVDWLSNLAAYFTAHPQVGLIGGSLLAPAKSRRGFAVCPHFDPPETLYDPASKQPPPAGWDWVGGNFAIRRAAMEQVGLFDEYLGAGTIFPAAEDTDYKLRLEALNIQMAATPRAIINHTYGYRYGMKAAYRHLRGYARGNGALAAKQTLAGDPRGKNWLAHELRQSTWGLIRTLRLDRAPFRLLRLAYFLGAYYYCLHRYRFDVAEGTLMPALASPQMSGQKS